MKIVVKNEKSFKKNSHGEKAAGVVVCVKTRRKDYFLPLSFWPACPRKMRVGENSPNL